MRLVPFSEIYLEKLANQVTVPGLDRHMMGLQAQVEAILKATGAHFLTYHKGRP